MITYISQNGKITVLGDYELMHFNHNHDRLGRFARGNGVSSAARRSTKLDKWKAKQSTKLEKRYGKELGKADKRISKASKKYSAKPTERRKNKLSYERFQKKQLEGQRKIERTYLKKASYENMKRENASVRKERAKNYIWNAAMFTAPLPVKVYRITNPNNIRYNYRSNVVQDNNYQPNKPQRKKMIVQTKRR